MFDRHCCSDNDPKICMDCYERETKGRREAMDMLRDILNDGAKFEHAGEEHEFHADFDKATKMVTEYFANKILSGPEPAAGSGYAGGTGCA